MLIIADHADYPIERGNNDRVYVWLGDEAAAEHLIASSRLGRFFGCTFQVRQIALDLGPRHQDPRAVFLGNQIAALDGAINRRDRQSQLARRFLARYRQRWRGNHRSCVCAAADHGSRTRFFCSCRFTARRRTLALWQALQMPIRVSF